MSRYFFVVVFYCFIGLPSIAWSATYHVATYGSDGAIGTGSAEYPWATITHALDSVEDGSVIEVHPGTYNGRIRIRGTFARGVTVRSQTPYQARLRNSGTVITAYADDARGVSGITLEGFDIAHSGSGAGALVVHIDGNGNNAVKNITLKNNILHDSYNNDILKINNSCTNRNLVAFATPAKGSPLVDHADPAFAPVDDILGNIRSSKPDVGAFEFNPVPEGNPPKEKFTVAPMLLLLEN